MASTFTWLEDWSSEQQHKPRNFLIQLGDGYMERTANGLNADLPIYNANFKARSSVEAGNIMTFLTTTCGSGTLPFNFQPYGDLASSLWICNDFKLKPVQGGYYDITCVFQKVVA